MASILWNQNNCAAEGGPATTGYEVQVGGDLCEMVGLNRDTSLRHLVAGGSVANIEAIWVARNLKYYALGLQEALLKEEQLKGARDYEVETELTCYVQEAKCGLFIFRMACSGWKLTEILLFSNSLLSRYIFLRMILQLF